MNRRVAEPNPFELDEVVEPKYNDQLYDYTWPLVSKSIMHSLKLGFNMEAWHAAYQNLTIFQFAHIKRVQNGDHQRSRNINIVDAVRLSKVRL